MQPLLIPPLSLRGAFEAMWSMSRLFTNSIASCVFLIFTRYVTAEFVLSPSMTEAEKYVNQTFIVTCKGEENTTWYGPNGQPIRNIEGRVHVEEKKKQIVELYFEAISRGDRGNYTCTSVVQGDVVKTSFSLIVVKPVAFLGELNEQNVTEFQNIQVRCEVTGDPQPIVVWQVKSRPIPQNNSRYVTMPGGLYIKNVTVQDDGWYGCKAYQITTKTSNLKTRYIKLNVQHKPRWPKNNKTNKDLVYGYAGGVANISCFPESNPVPDYTWTRYNSSLNPAVTNVINEGFQSVLQVSMVNDSVLGSYECRAQNGLGEVFKIFELNLGFKPAAPRHIAQGGVGLTTANFHLHAISKDQVIGYRIQFVKRAEKKPVDQGDYQDFYTRDGHPYTLIHLSPNTEYVYRVASRNPAGLSDFSPPQTFRTREQHASSAGTFSLDTSVFTFILSMVLGGV